MLVKVMSRRWILKDSNKTLLQSVNSENIKKLAQLVAYAHLVVEEAILTTYRRAKVSSEIENWKGAMDEIDSYRKTTFPKGKKAIRYKWVFTMKK